MADDLVEKLPSLDVFEEHFARLTYSTDDDSRKRLIQYFFEKYETTLRKSTELVVSDLTLEHVAAQKFGMKGFDQIGNLVPIAEHLNGMAGTKSLSEKLKIYAESQFRVTKDFVKKHNSKHSWGANDIDERNRYLAATALNKIFRVSAKYYDKKP